MIIEIKNLSGEILHTIEAENIKDAVETLVKRRADLGDAYLRGAYLEGAYLGDAKYGDDIPLTKIPIFVSGLNWDVLVLDTHLKIGCELHPFATWETDGDKIAARHKETEWWSKHKEMIFAITKTVR